MPGKREDVAEWKPFSGAAQAERSGGRWPVPVGVDRRVRLRAGILALVVSIALLGLKYLAYALTGSTAILSDALESIVNVIAAGFALGSVVVAERPADRNHPYGHGKVEFFSAAFEGGLIAFAALLILWEAGKGLIRGVEIHELGAGMALTLVAGACNAAVGWYLVRTGRRLHSLSLEADGRHLLADFWTSAAVVGGLGLVKLTGMSVFDPLVAAAVGAHLVWTGFRLVRYAAGGLLDEEDRELLERLVGAINANMTPDIIRVHHLRAIRSGRFHHVDAHLVVPEFWPVEKAHEVADAFEARVIAALPFDGEIVFHLDPCRQLYCRACEIADCPIRREPFEARRPITVDEAVETDIPTARRWGMRARNAA